MIAPACWLLALGLLFIPETTLAHPAFSGAGGFSGGLLHPLFVPAHLIGIAGIAALIAQQQPKWDWPSHWLAPMMFVSGLAIGSFAIASAYVPVYSAESVLVCAAMAGLLLAFARPFPWVIPILAGVTGVVIALDSPPDAISIREAILIQFGTVCGAAILLVAVIGIVARRRYRWQRIGIQIAGSWIAASAIMVLALQLVR